MVELNKDTSVRVDRQTKNNLDTVAEKEGLSVKECLSHMSLFFVKNRIGVKDEYIGTAKRIEDLFKIIRAMEKGYFEPLLMEIRKVLRFTENFDFNLIEDELKREVEAQGVEIKTETKEGIIEKDANKKDVANIETLKRANFNLIDKLNSLINNDRMTSKAGVGGTQSYVLRLSPQEIDDIKKTIELCTIR